MKKAILKVLFKPLTGLNRILKKKKQIFLYSNLGFRDNVRAFYEFLIDNHYNEKFKIVVSINDYTEYIGREPKNVSYISNKKGIFHFMRSKYAFYCFGKYPIKPSKNQMVINLWHGTPLKKLGHLERGCEKIDYHFFTKVLASGEMYKPIMAEIFGCDEADVDVMGNPRNDCMFVANDKIDPEIKGNAKKLIVWLPTYREYDNEFVVSLLNERGLSKLEKFLASKDVKIIIKLHPLQGATVERLKYEHIIFLTQDRLQKNDMTVYDLLRNADALITDYSSVYFDYLLLDRPIGFAIDDIETYSQKRGLIFDNPKEYMPGPILSSIKDVESFINNVMENVDNYKEKRKDVNNKVNKYQDGNSAKRIAEKYIID